MANERYDFVVIGSGFAGSIMSMILRRLGKSVLMVEQGSHPRFAIGESSTPFANLLLEKIAADYDLPFLRDLSEWGSWQEKHPNLGVGLKRGFSFFHHSLGERTDFADRNRQLLVAASPNDRVADTHWYRPDFDSFLVKQAIETGVVFTDLTKVRAFAERGNGWQIDLLRAGKSTIVETDFIIDASGGNSEFANRFAGAREDFKVMPPTMGVWAHFRSVKRQDETESFFASSLPPYPVDDAAVHHVFPGGWIWVLRFNNGITSAGAAFQKGTDLDGKTPEETWSKVLENFPSVKEIFTDAQAVTSFYESSQLSFRRARIAGANWALLPSAAGFVDPLLSTGFALTLLGIVRLADAFSGGRWTLDSYAEVTLGELDATADLVSALYAKMHSPKEFNLLTLLYFAAVSFTETAWRLGKPELASSFLLGNNENICRGRSKLCAVARAGGAITQEAVASTIATYDIAGLGDFRRANWYPVDFNDLVANSHKVQASDAELERLFKKLKISVDL